MYIIITLTSVNDHAPGIVSITYEWAGIRRRLAETAVVIMCRWYIQLVHCHTTERSADWLVSSASH